MNPVEAFEHALLANRVAGRYAAAEDFSESEAKRALQETARKLGGRCGSL